MNIKFVARFTACYNVYINNILYCVTCQYTSTTSYDTIKLTHTGYLMIDEVIVSIYRASLVVHVSEPLLLSERWRISVITSSSSQESNLTSPEYEAFLVSNTVFCELFTFTPSTTWFIPYCAQFHVCSWNWFILLLARDGWMCQVQLTTLVWNKN